ncbi:hypothetical protein PoB_003548300 [Plakobranchus ocellatus]|uniref:Uncharacterized protein n=1 Tax=Plakobranchus ocellatus TaxID=259542 RepID=A0AAV4ANQ8_9GAST|nr:hypothetical protein PoB_003548300 [Plakobranchus ocellatus]
MASRGSIHNHDQSFASHAHPHGGQSFARSTQGAVSLPHKRVKLPQHVEDVLHAQRTADLPYRKLTGVGLFTTQALLPSLDRKLKRLPWDKPASQSLRSSDSAGELSTAKSRTLFGRPRGATQQMSVSGTNRYAKLLKIIDNNQYRKITFTNTNEPMEIIPNWVTHRLQDSCRSTRFTLPSDYRRLQEKMRTLVFKWPSMGIYLLVVFKWSSMGISWWCLRGQAWDLSLGGV